MNIRAVMSLIRHVAFWEPHSGRFENAETGYGNFPSAVCAEAAECCTYRVCCVLAAGSCGRMMLEVPPARAVPSLLLSLTLGFTKQALCLL